MRIIALRGPIRGYKKMLNEQPEVAKEKLRNIIKNTYRTLMTRGIKGCYVYFEDEGLRGRFEQNQIFNH